MSHRSEILTLTVSNLLKALVLMFDYPFVPLKKLSGSETGLDRFCFSYFQIVLIGLVNKKNNYV